MKKDPELFDVAIIGGSVSGSYASILFAEKNYRVALIERDKLPRRKACGEGMTRYAKKYLKRIGVWDLISPEFIRPFYGYEIFDDT